MSVIAIRRVAGGWTPLCKTKVSNNGVNSGERKHGGEGEGRGSRGSRDPR
jgi:hypothetical protein